MSKFQTKKHGYNDDEVKSALQKEIRRGNEKEAMYWALEIAMEGKSSFGWLRNRLKIIAYEDIGLANPDAVLQVSKAVDDMDYLYNETKTDEWMMALSYIILLMCRSMKSRICDHFKVAMEHRWNVEKEDMVLDIPDYALDMHTTKGNKLGRTKHSNKGIQHFINIGAYLGNENPDIDDIYRELAYKVWIPKRE